MIGAVGANDPYYASLLRPTLEQSGVSARGVTEIERSQTGTATILVESNSGENRILVVPGANHDGMSDVQATIEHAMRARRPDVVVMQGEIPKATVVGLLQHFNGSSTHVIFNPAPVFPEGIPLEALSGLAVLAVNETECIQLAATLGNISTPTADAAEAKLSHVQLQEITGRFRELAKVQTVIVTLGSEGAFFSTVSGQQGFVPGVKIDKVVDTTAAGDTFVGYFATALARSTIPASRGFDVHAAATAANRAAALCVQKSGAMQSIPFGYE